MALILPYADEGSPQHCVALLPKPASCDLPPFLQSARREQAWPKTSWPQQVRSDEAMKAALSQDRQTPGMLARFKFRPSTLSMSE